MKKLGQYKKTIGILGIAATAAFSKGWVQPNYTQTYSDSEIRAQLEALKGRSRAETVLPSRVDHSHSIHMRPVFNQGYSGSCGSASRIGYMFGYEINAYRNLDGSRPENIYPSFFTWLLTDQNSGKEGMAMFNGIPNSVVYGGDQASHIFHEDKIWNVGWATDPDGVNYGWMQGYDRWNHAAKNRLERPAYNPLTSLEYIEYAKRWMFDHLGDTTFSEGGVLGGGVASEGWNVTTIPGGSYRAGEKIITKFGPQTDHAITWAGYDDSISFDLDDNGTISEDEKGAFILLNSWGSGWANQGTAYVPYKLLIETQQWAEFYYIRKDYRPKDMMKITMNYNQRNNLKLSIGIAESADASEPATIVEAEHFKWAGISPIPMLGVWQDGVLHEESMEFGIDFSDLSFGYDTRKSFRYFLVVETDSDASGSGRVENCQAIRYSYGADKTMEPHDSLLIDADSFDGEISGSGKKILIPITMPGDSSAVPECIYIPQKRLAIAYVNSENADAPATNVLDGNQQTMWHSRWSTGNDPYPHQITVKVDSLYTLCGIEYLPRQDASGNGRIGKYEIYVSDSPNTPGTLVASGQWENDTRAKRLFFEPVLGTYITIRSLSAANGDNNTCMAELNVLAKVNASDPVASKMGGTSMAKPSVMLVGNQLHIASITGAVSLQLFSVNGRQLYSENKIASGKMEFSLDPSLAKGVYVARIKAAGIELNRQIIVK